MDTSGIQDHAVGVELQLVELVEQHERAVVQGRDDDAHRLQAEIDILQNELARTAELLGEAAEPAHFDDVTEAAG
ncbi:MAG TPA: hypothetical protein VM030_11385 [Acidimicrobiales bacterium]|nr:hypothetical protein [Acidimicrobiales bacterium]